MLLPVRRHERPLLLHVPTPAAATPKVGNSGFGKNKVGQLKLVWQNSWQQVKMATLENLWYLSGFPEGTLISGPICKLQDTGISTLAMECIWWLSTWSTLKGGSQVSRHEELHTCCVACTWWLSHKFQDRRSCTLAVECMWRLSLKFQDVRSCTLAVEYTWWLSHKFQDARSCTLAVEYTWWLSHKFQDARSCTLTVECMWRLSTWSTPRGGSQATRWEELHTCCGMYVTAEHLEHTKDGSQLTRCEELHTCCGI